MLYCIRVSSVTTRSYLSTTTSNLLTSLLVCCLLLDVSSSWFLWYEKSLGGNMRLVDVLYGRPLFPSSPRIFRMFSKIAVSSGLTYFVTQKLLRSTGFPLLYANFDNLLENRCGQS